MDSHYFDDDPTSEDRRRDVDVHVWGHTLRCTTSSGVFSRDGLDHATRLLLESGEPPSGAPSILDLGCGWGPIACLLAAAAPDATVWAVDVNERARELTALNAERHGLTVHVAAPDEVPDDVRFDAVWSNPPIRVGKAALHELLVHWLDRLTDDGQARLVVGKNLGADSLQRWLTQQGWPTQRVSSEKGFRVLLAHRRSA